MKDMDVWKAFSILHQKTKVTVQTYLKIKTLEKVVCKLVIWVLVKI